MIIAWTMVFTASTMMMSMLSVVKADMSVFDVIPDQACGATCSFTRTVRSLVDCMTTCDQGSSLCYNPVAASCTCCSDTVGGSTCPAAHVTTECFQRHVVCPEGWTEIGDYCVMGHTGQLNLDSCKSFCKSSGARILTLYNQTEKDVVKPFVGSLSGSDDWTWLGVFTNSSGIGNRQWYYIDNGDLVTYFNWAHGEPKNVGNENCVAMTGSLDKWFDIPCGWNATCICQM